MDYAVRKRVKMRQDDTHREVSLVFLSDFEGELFFEWLQDGDGWDAFERWFEQR